ncbi:MAG: hypothetical protein AABX85_01125 [Nanoarchaeota archaeon]
MKFNRLAKFVGTGLVGVSTLLPISNVNADNLELRNNGGGTSEGIGASIPLYVAHQSGAFEEGYVGVDDSSWAGSIPNPTQPEMKIITSPYGAELRTDKRPLTSETMFHAELSAVDRDNPSATINTSTNRIRAKVMDDLNQNALYILKSYRDSAYTPSGQEINFTTNLVSALGGRTVGKEFWVNWPGITNLPSGYTNGTIDISCKFTNQLSQTGNQTPITINLSENQVSGLEYILTSGTNVNGEAHIENGTNLVYTPSTSFIGTNNINSRLKWEGNDIGDINYAVGVTNQAVPVLYTPSITGITNMGDGNVQIGARVSPGYNHILNESTNVYAPNWIPVATNTVPFANDTNQVNTSYSVPADKPRAFFRVGSY